MTVALELNHQRIYPSEINRALQPVPAVMSELALDTLLGQVYIGGQRLVDLFQDAMQAESNNFQQETFLIDGKYYKITEVGREEGIGNIVEVDGVWYPAKKYVNADGVFVGWTPLEPKDTMRIDENFKGNIYIVEVEAPTPVPTTTTAPVPTRVPDSDYSSKTTESTEIGIPSNNQSGNGLTLEENMKGILTEDIPNAFKRSSPINKIKGELGYIIELVSDPYNLFIAVGIIVLLLAGGSIVGRTRQIRK